MIQYLTIDVTRFKVYGASGWKVKKHCADGKWQVWCKLHLAIGFNTHAIIMVEFSASNVTCW
ncbi:transposase [Candidatus Enterovibrio altilux]|uniref:transposase n=1 Tax=Candidatus Enterovibrio altilux TaxID=1927128 RepID=UPI003741F909